MGRLFGTDGVRGLANAEPLTPDFTFRLGRVATAYLRERHAPGRSRSAILIGRDTRLSGPLLEQAFVAGVLSTGTDAWVAGVLPTPGVAMLTRLLGAIGGVVLSASHNPFEDNGIKIFGADGGKLPDAWEDQIEARLSGPDGGPRPTGAGIGRLRALPGAEARYVEALRATVSPALDLGGLRVVLDCADGATYRVAPRLLRHLGAEVVAIGVRPTGLNINRGGGALHPERLQARVRSLGRAIGLALDGDGDRLVTVDEDGEVRDGDYLLAIYAGALQARGGLRGDVVVSTTMANLGLERALAELGLGMVRTPVGDRYVLEEMHRRGANLGGEQSGHIIFLDLAPTGDGLLSALQLLWIVKETGRPLTELAASLSKLPQALVNVRVRAKPPLPTLPRLTETVRRWEADWGGRLRILLRYSGTEPLARVMVEGENGVIVDRAAAEIGHVLQMELGERR